ncbi:MAG: hypothetical protein KAU94_09160 [Verrucomicrobia bacterium]|nr:hypothetical protein [Verrucomicrobiota bacterium]
MSSAQAILLFILATNTAVSLIVFFTNPKRSQNRLFLLFSSSLAFWVAFVLSVINSRTSLTAEIGIRGASIAGAFIPVSFYLFCQSISAPELSFFRLCAKSKVILALSGAVSLMCGTNFFLETVTMPTAENGLLVPETAYGPGFILFMLFFPIVIYRTIYVFYKTLKTSAGVAKVEMQFALVGMASALPFALLIHLIAIISGSTQRQQYGPLCIIPMNLVIAYGIATRRIMGIEKLLRQAIAYALLATILAATYSAVWFTTNYMLSDVMANPSLLSQIVATVVSLLMLAPTQRHMHTAASKLIATKSMDVSDTMKCANRVFQSVSTIDSLLSHFSKLIKSALGAKSQVILGIEKDAYEQKYPKTGTQNTILAKDNPIVCMLKTSKDTICQDSLERIRETSETISVARELRRVQATMATGIFSKGELTGILLVGSRAGGQIYDKNEQDALQILCNQFAVALENAHLYTEMQDSKIRNDIMLDQLVSGVIVASPERTITLINHEAQRITRLTEEQALGQDIGLLPEAISKALEASLSTQKGVQNTNAVLFAQEEQENMHVRMGSAYLIGPDNKPMGALLVFTNMTELKGLEEQVRRTDQLSSVGTLAAGMAHEIKNPLVTIKTFTQLLPERHADEEFRHDFSSLVAHEVSRIDGIVNQLLSFSKPPQPHLVPMELHDTIEQTLKLIREQLYQKNIVLNNNLRAKRDLISGDADLLAQTLVNLNLNAIEAIGSEGSITVTTTNCTYRFAQGKNPENAIKKSCIRLQIRDTGKGIAKNQLQKIFDPFFTSKSEGTGMGLSVAHGIIQEHHGVIEVESHPGKGTTFSIYIPLLKEDAAA